MRRMKLNAAHGVRLNGHTFVRQSRAETMDPPQIGCQTIDQANLSRRCYGSTQVHGVAAGRKRRFPVARGTQGRM